MRSVILLLVILTMLSVNTIAQETVLQTYDPVPRYREFGLTCCEDVRGNLDNFMIELMNDPEGTGLVMFYGGLTHPTCAEPNGERLPRRGELSYLITSIENHIKFRRFPMKRITWINGGYKDKLAVQLWHLPKGAKIPSPEPTVLKKDIKFKAGKPFRMAEWNCT